MDYLESFQFRSRLDIARFRSMEQRRFHCIQHNY
jgi:hypothetical protein